MSLVAVAIALMLPTALGALAWMLALGRPRGTAGWCACIGTGYLAGAIALGALLRLFDGFDVGTLFARLAPWLGGAVVAMAVLVWRRSVPLAEPATAASSMRERVATAALWTLAGCSFVLVLQQAIVLPTLTWDAWNAWLAKSKAWYHLGEFAPVLDTQAWIDAPAGSAISATAPGYPQALSRFAAWIASAAGGWSEPAIHSAWPLAWMAMGLACFGYLGLAGVRALPASVTSVGLLTLPLVTAHAALAGYADLWQAGLVMLAAAQVARAFALRSWRDAVAAVLLAALCTAVKLEGAVWMLCLAAAVVLAWLPSRWRRVLLLAPLLAVLWVWLVGALALPLPGLGMVRFEWGALELPVIGRLVLAWRPVVEQFALSLWLLPNWSLLWYLVPVVLVLRWRRLAHVPGTGVLAAFVALGTAFLMLLFFFTDAAVWAQNYTSSNRVLLQLVPTLVLWLTLLWSAPALRGTAPSTPR